MDSIGGESSPPASVEIGKPLHFDDISAQGQARLLDLSYARIVYGINLLPVVGIPFIFWLYELGQRVSGWLAWGLFFALLAVAIRFQHRIYQSERAQSANDAQTVRKWLPVVHRLPLVYGAGLVIPFLFVAVESPPFDFSVLFLGVVAAIVAGNATHQSPALGAFQRFFLTGWSGIIMLLPWTFPEHWQYIMPLTLLYIVWIYKHAIDVHRFFLQHVKLEEDGVKLAEGYRVAKVEAETALHDKNLFLSTASHDLRQPVHAMGFLIESIARRNTDSALIPALLDLKQSVRSVTQMFNSLLDLSKIEAGAVQVCAETVFMDELLKDVATVFREEASTRGLGLRVRTSGGKAMVRADALLLRQSMINLVHNALRYTKRGGVLISVRKRGGDWQFGVWDTGVGVAIADQDRIYSPFFRNEHAWRIDSAGHGLGLAVVARCATLMGATYGFSSRETHGSHFWLRLPAATDADAQLKRSGSAKENPGIALAYATYGQLAGTCLIVDDDPHVCGAWESLLASWGFQVKSVDSGSHALALVEDGFIPQAIFCDQRLRTGESGFDVLRELLGRFPDASGAMISGEFDSPELRQAENDGYLVLRKPLEPEQLFAVLSHWLVQDAVGESRVAARTQGVGFRE